MNVGKGDIAKYSPDVQAKINAEYEQQAGSKLKMSGRERGQRTWKNPDATRKNENSMDEWAHKTPKQRECRLLAARAVYVGESLPKSVQDRYKAYTGFDDIGEIHAILARMKQRLKAIDNE